MEHNIQRNFIKSKLITATEAAKVLGLSRQHVTKLARDGQLQYLRKIDNGYIFMLEDIEAYINSKINSNMMNARKIYGGSCRQVFETIVSMQRENNIDSIKLFFSGEEAVSHGFGIIDGGYKDNQLYRYIGPTAVITFYDADEDKYEELFFSGVNCGYPGEGPKTAVMLCKLAGIDDELAEQVYDNVVIYFAKEDCGWTISYNVNESPYKEYEVWAMDTYYRNSRPVYIPREFCNCMGHGGLQIENLVCLCKRYIPEIYTISIYCKSEAIKQGRYVSYYRDNALMPVAITGRLGEEIWLNYPFNDDALKSYMKQFLGEYGYSDIHINKTLKQLKKQQKNKEIKIVIE